VEKKRQKRLFPFYLFAFLEKKKKEKKEK